MKLLTGTLLALSLVISFIIGGAVFNLGFCNGAVSVVVGGLPVTQRLDDEPEAPMSWQIDDFHLQTTERYYQTVSDAYVQWGSR